MSGPNEMRTSEWFYEFLFATTINKNQMFLLNEPREKLRVLCNSLFMKTYTFYRPRYSYDNKFAILLKLNFSHRFT